MSDASDDLPLVSIVVPAHNVSPYIDACLWAIRRQTHSALEVVVVDDGSTDDSASIAERHARDDPRIRVVRHETNHGVAVARNTALERVTGTYVAFADADDLMDPHLVEICVAAATRLSADVVQFTHRPIDADTTSMPCHHGGAGDLTTTDVTGDAYLRLPAMICCTFVRASLLSGTKEVFLDRRRFGDKHFHWRLGLASTSSHHLDEPLFGYRARPGSLTSGRGETRLELIDSFVDVARLLESEGALAQHAPTLQQKSLEASWRVLTTIERPFLAQAVGAARALSATYVRPHSPGRPTGARESLLWALMPWGSAVTRLAFEVLRPVERALQPHRGPRPAPRRRARW